jgi:hypothetical protein
MILILDIIHIIFDAIKKGLTYKNILRLNKQYNASYISHKDKYENNIIRLIDENPDISWDWSGLSRNPNITWNVIQNNLHKPWNWRYVSCNPNITWEIILNNINKPWYWDALSHRKDITIDILKQLTNKPLNWQVISKNISSI